MKYLAGTIVNAIALLASGIAEADAEQVCSAAHVKAQLMKRDAPDKLIERRNVLRTCAGTVCPHSIVDACSKWLTELSIPSIVLEPSNGAGAAIRDAHTSIDGVRLAGSGPFELNPGSHALVVEAMGYVTVRRELLVEAEKEVRVPIILAPASSESPESRLEQGTVTWPVYVAFGVAVVGLVSTIGFGAAASSEANDLRNDTNLRCSSVSIVAGADCAGGASTAPYSELDLYRGLMLAALGVTLASAGVGTYLLLRPREATQQGAYVGLGLGSLSVKGRF